ncbi:ABC transporter ATP-binding protein [Sphingobacterium sp. HSC-15S19]|uniref:ABC transporter ATP-binding protein n=1 Tax=Sphingobacterium sp. HSC-15S19 TaxID=2910971 RepID=UPI003D257A3C
MDNREYIIEVSNLNKFYANTQVLTDINLFIGYGETIGILGENGAGKSTLLESIEGLRSVDKGSIRVFGLDIKYNLKEIQERVGIQLQKATLFEELSVQDNLKLFYKLYNVKNSWKEVINGFSLDKILNLKVGNLSGGQFQRVNLCLAMINNPKLLFLDEPTTGLDPNARTELWEKIRHYKAMGSTIILTTHYMEEAEALCDRIVFLRKGCIVADDSPFNLTKRTGSPRQIKIETAENLGVELISELQNMANIAGNIITIQSDNSVSDLSNMLNLLNNREVRIVNVNLSDSNLEDVYKSLYNKTILKD